MLWAVALANEKKAKFRQIVKARNNGLLVLTDRYPQTDVPGASDGPLLSRYQGGKGLLSRIAAWERHIYRQFPFARRKNRYDIQSLRRRAHSGIRHGGTGLPF